jgi:hypothetical protein
MGSDLESIMEDKNFIVDSSIGFIFSDIHAIWIVFLSDINELVSYSQ